MRPVLKQSRYSLGIQIEQRSVAGRVRHFGFACPGCPACAQEREPVYSVSQVDSGHSKALSLTSSSSSSSKRRRDAEIKASIASLQAKQLAERVKRDNEVREQEFQEEMAQRELDWKLECRKRELDLLRKKREDEMAVISAQNQAEVANLKHEILGQEFNEGKGSNDEIFKTRLEPL